MSLLFYVSTVAHAIGLEPVVRIPGEMSSRRAEFYPFSTMVDHDGLNLGYIS